jgi:hypothetical protein
MPSVDRLPDGEPANGRPRSVRYSGRSVRGRVTGGRLAVQLRAEKPCRCTSRRRPSSASRTPCYHRRNPKPGIVGRR